MRQSRLREIFGSLLRSPATRREPVLPASSRLVQLHVHDARVVQRVQTRTRARRALCTNAAPVFAPMPVGVIGLLPGTVRCPVRPVLARGHARLNAWAHAGRDGMTEQSS
jgi:hypothetical protein